MSIGEEQVECPLCMEPLEMDDSNFFPCTCGYQICRFCWHRIRTDENGLCPACRKAYQEDPAEFKPLTDDELQRIKKERKLKDLQRRQRAAENRKHLANVRVVQKNLVFAVGLSQRLGDVEMLRKHDYFGKFGKIVKVVINQTTSYAGAQVGGPSASAYITYQKPEDALRAIQAVNNIHVDGRTLKASLGTTKYCSHFLKGTQCPKPDCMYLHELGEELASFTKEEMQQGKHQEYEQKLYETYMNHLNTVTISPPNTESKPTQTTKARTKTNSPTGGGTTTAASISPPLPLQQNTTDAWPSLNHNSTDTDKGTERDEEETNCGASVNNACSVPCSSSHSPPPPPPPLSSHSPPLLQNNTGCSTSTGFTHANCSSSSSSSSSSNITQSGTAQSLPAPLQKPPSLLDMPLQRPPGLSTNSINHNSRVLQSDKHRHGLSTDTAAVPPLLSCSASAAAAAGSASSRLAAPTTHSQHQPSSLITPGSSFFTEANDNLSLFGLSGFTRKPIVSLPTAAVTAAQIPGADQRTVAQDVVTESLNVSAPTDWSAAFGFKPSASIQSVAAPIHSAHVTSTSLLAPHSTDSGDDDLGFDPWGVSTRALQDLIEKESSAQPTTTVTAAADSTSSSSSLTSPLHTHYNLMMHGGGGLLNEHLLQQQQERNVKHLPPGFAPSHINNTFPHHHHHHHHHQPHIGGSRVLSFMKMNQNNACAAGHTSTGDGFHGHASHQSLNHHNTLSANSAAAATDRNNSFSVAPSLGNGYGHVGEGESYSRKDWQDDLRALLPNINIHFGPTQQQNHLQQHRHPAQQSKQWDPSWDPAVVTTGNVSHHEQMNGDDVPHWMESLHHLTEEPTAAHHNTVVTNNKCSANFPSSSSSSNNNSANPASVSGTSSSSSFMQGVIAAAAVVPTPPPGFQHPLRATTAASLEHTSHAAAALADGYQ